MAVGDLLNGLAGVFGSPPRREEEHRRRQIEDRLRAAEDLATFYAQQMNQQSVSNNSVFLSRNTTGPSNTAVGWGALSAADTQLLSGEFCSILAEIQGKGSTIKGKGDILHVAGRGCRLLDGNVVVHRDTWFEFTKTVSLEKKDILTSIPELFLHTVEIAYKGKKQNFNINFLDTNCSFAEVLHYTNNDRQVTITYRIEVKKNSVLIKLPVEFYNERTVGLRHATF